MEAIYSSTALQNNQREIKDIARRQVVHITENGNGAFVFCSEELFQQAIDDAVEEAELRMVVERGMADVSAGRTYEGTDAVRAEIERRVASRG